VLLKIHLLVGLFLFTCFSYQSVIGGYPSGGVMNWTGFVAGWFFASFLIFSSAVMLIPSIFLAKAVGPEIILKHDTLIYLGGSNAIKDGGFALLFKPLIYLEGMEPSFALKKNAIQSISITTSKDFFTKFKFNTGSKDFIEIKHKEGSLFIGGGFTDIAELLQKLINWHNRD